MTRILMVLSASDHWTLKDGTRHPTGYWAEEFVVPHNEFRTQGVEVVVATPGGVAPTVDQRSLNPEMAGGERKATAFRDYLDAIATELARPMVLEQAVGHVADYDAIYIPGGHAPMEDLAGCQPLGELLVQFFDTGRFVTAVCHGVAALLSADRRNGGWLFEGRRMTGYTNEEERLVGLADRAPWLLEDRLRERGADFKPGAPWEPHVVVDTNLLTGQNPASSQAATDRTLSELRVHNAL
ncbi:type 1 glutamine amidotransferase domain-containing protein [Amycolatopsis sp. CA-126428]|uniref:type 1 glutamine amidotransferase domain-containing protein n=1 Tax=Amycolatopsis sp. CA-126428 TaxID=2073158 RepID=UPI000CD23586|nr:type 1 glutamine amidotransferase domain-containing protein [Amycolatopsis sp. CA-126428]